MTALTRMYTASLDRWGVARELALTLSVVAIAGIPVLAALVFVDREIFGLVLDEDRLVEWSQVAVFAGAGVMGAKIAADRFRRRFRWQGVIWIVFMLAMIFICGEEISWGQRLLGLETPEILEEINKQNEITLHNIGNTLTVFNLVLFLSSPYAITADWNRRRWNLAGRWADGARLYVPSVIPRGTLWGHGRLPRGALDLPQPGILCAHQPQRVGGAQFRGWSVRLRVPVSSLVVATRRGA